MYGKEKDTQDPNILFKVTYPMGIWDNSIICSDIFSEDLKKQTAVTKQFAALLQRREDASALAADLKHLDNATIHLVVHI